MKPGPKRTFTIGKNELNELYQKHSGKQIAEICGVGETVVWKRIKEYGIVLEGVKGGHRCKKGVVRSDEHRKNLSKALQGKRRGPENYNWNGGLKKTICQTCSAVFEQRPGGESSYCSVKCRAISHRFRQSGPGNNAWKGGRDRQRPNKTRDKALRREAIKRAKTACEECGISGLSSCSCCGQTPDLHVHHVKPWKEYPKLRYDLENVRVLCTSCHRAVHREK